MATKKDVHDLFLNHVNSNAVKTRKMMGEYIIYYDGVVIGGLYDNRLLVKATKSAQQKLQDNTLVSPYPGAKEMILIPDFDEATNLTDLFKTIKNDLKKWSVGAERTKPIDKWSLVKEEWPSLFFMCIFYFVCFVNDQQCNKYE